MIEQVTVKKYYYKDKVRYIYNNIEFNNSFSYPVDRFDSKKLSIKDIHHRTRDSNSIKIIT